MKENGVNINRYAQKMKFKDRQKKKYIDRFRSWRTYNSWEDFVAHEDYEPWRSYWKAFYLSGSRKLAKGRTNSVLRTEFKDELAHCDDYEELVAPQNSDYRKHFDYDWTIW